MQSIAKGEGLHVTLPAFRLCKLRLDPAAGHARQLRGGSSKQCARTTPCGGWLLSWSGRRRGVQEQPED